MEDNIDEPTPKDDNAFKKPVLFGRIGKLPKKVKKNVEEISEDRNKESTSNLTDNDTKKSLPPAMLLKEISTPIPYKEPKWSGLCPDGSNYGLEVIKSGMIMEKVDLTTKAYYVFGRLANCDVVMAHPTISRHHAVLQYKAFAEADEPASGWYLFDLGSTHGTFLNRDRIKPNHYVRVRVGHQIKFGNSTRIYIMLGPDFDCEGESELTVTEIKKRAESMKLERDRLIKEAVEQRKKDKLEEERKREEQGIDWGMGEDAEEEPDLADNPYATAANEELYLQDPKKTLRGYFEREGHELNYHCEERGAGQFLCRVELPMEDARGNPVMAEVLHRGKKKEAVIAAALEACRILDRAGLLRQATHESRRRKQRDWSADDYYDSDDDNFLDRTGSVETKRHKRMQKHAADDKPLTYDDLLEQIKEIEGKITSEEAVLTRLRESSRARDSSEDDLDAYMMTLTGPSMAQKAEISKTKMNISKLKTELATKKRLADIARPAAAPPLLKSQDTPQSSQQISKSQDTPKIKTANNAIYGKRIKLKEDKEKRPKTTPTNKQETEFVEEMDSDEETTEKMDAPYKRDNPTEDSDNGNKKEKATDIAKQVKVETTKDGRIFGPMRPPENYVPPENYFDQESDRDLPEIMEPNE